MYTKVMYSVHYMSKGQIISVIGPVRGPLAIYDNQDDRRDCLYMVTEYIPPENISTGILGTPLHIYHCALLDTPKDKDVEFLSWTRELEAMCKELYMDGCYYCIPMDTARCDPDGPYGGKYMAKLLTVDTGCIDNRLVARTLDIHKDMKVTGEGRVEIIHRPSPLRAVHGEYMYYEGPCGAEILYAGKKYGYWNGNKDVGLKRLPTEVQEFVLAAQTLLRESV